MNDRLYIMTDGKFGPQDMEVCTLPEGWTRLPLRLPRATNAMKQAYLERLVEQFEEVNCEKTWRIIALLDDGLAFAFCEHVATAVALKLMVET